jgi:8-oxo-dGTP pyrophosphatase MutT (NUDIX family)
LPAKRQSIFSDPSPAGGVTEPRDAATVILIRDAEPGPFEVLLMQRHRDQNFMGGAHVFPGGALEPQDCDPALARRVTDLTPAVAAGRLGEPDLEPAMALGLFFAAVRETMEESGVLLGVSQGRGARPDADLQQRLNGGERTFAALAREKAWRFSMAELVPYARWITPALETKRFDTRFMLARLPNAQTPVHDSREMTRAIWLAPEQALAMQAAGTIELMPPTLKTVTELSAHVSAHALMAAAMKRRPPTIRPRVFIAGTEFGIKLPADPQYHDAGAPLTLRQTAPTRVVMRNGRWQIMSARDFVRGVDTDGRTG